MNPRIDDLIALAALGELSAEEARELDAAVLADPEVAGELAAALDTAAALQTAGATAPPPALKMSVLDAIADLPQEPPAGAGAGDSGTDTGTGSGVGSGSGGAPGSAQAPSGPNAPAPVAPRHDPSPEVGDVEDIGAGAPAPAAEDPGAHRGRPSGGAGSDPGSEAPPPGVRSIGSARSRRFPMWLAAAAAVVVVVGAVVVLSDRGGDDGRSAEIAAVLEAEDAQPHSVAGEIGELEFVYSPSQDAFVLVGDSLQLPPDDATYQVWLVKEGGQTSLGTFEPEDDGDMEMRADGIDPSGATIGISLEPEGGSTQPTSPMVAESVV